MTRVAGCGDQWFSPEVVRNSPPFWDAPYLGLNGNQLRGPIPELSALSLLRDLYLYDNQLSGPIPDLNALTNLTLLILNGSELSGRIPDLNALSKLRALYLFDNQLSGPIPDLSALSKLISLDLSGNLLCLPAGTTISGLNEQVAAHLESLNLSTCTDAD